jgi:hypothetical protein
MRHVLKLSAQAALVLTCTSLALFAQEFRASLQGRVTNSTGEVVSGASVTAVNVERGLSYESVTNSSGQYKIAALIPGTYDIRIAMPEFGRFTRSRMELPASSSIQLDAALIPAVFESIEVTAAGPAEDVSSFRRDSFENRILENVPSGGRNLFALQYDQPGVVKASTYWGAMEPYAFGNVNAVTIGGGRVGENEIVIDGVTATKSDRGVAFVPPIAATEEFAVQSNSYDAQFGRIGGGVTIITLKSGTNSFHGQLFEYFKNDKLRANDWVANKNGISATPFKNNTFGGELGGPVRNNVSFFLISFEGLRQRGQGNQIRTLPTLEQLRGDFSELRNTAGSQIRIYDPLSTRLGSDGTFVRTPFENNVIPAARLNPVALRAASYYPSPNRPPDGLNGLNNYAKSLAERNGYDSWLGKLDHSWSSKSRSSVRYGQTPWSNYQGLVWGNNPAEPSNRYPQTRVFRNASADWSYQATPALLFNIRAGASRFETSTGNTFGVNFDPRLLGFPDALVKQFRTLEFPRFNITGYSELGSQSVLNYTAQEVWSLQLSVTWTVHSHNLRIGAELRRYNDNTLNPGLASGSYSFTAAWTQANPQRADSASGNALASFLLGHPASGFVDRNVNPAYRAHYYAGYVQDDVRVHPRVTLNLGFRWDHETPRYERYNQMVRGFAFDQPSPVAAIAAASPAAANCPACSAGLLGGLLYANDANRYAFVPHRRNFQPRLGASYKLASRLLLRGGYAISYLGQNAFGPATGFSRQTPLAATLDNGLTPVVSLNDPFPAAIFPDGLLQPIGASQGLATNLGQNVTFQCLDRPLPYSQQYSAGFQVELPSGWLLDASYVGNLTKRLPVALGLNFIPRGVLESLPAAQRPAFFNQQIANPLAGLLPNSSINGSTVARQQLLFAFPQYGSGTQVTDVPIGRQRYDSAQFKLTRRFAQNFGLTVAYTVSKTLEQISTLNPQDVNLDDLLKSKLEKRLTAFDVPQQLSIMGTYSVPGRYQNQWLDRVARDWTISGVWMSHSGFPIAFPDAAPLEARSARLTDAQRDELARKNGRPRYDPSYDVWFDTSLFPQVAQAPFTLRNFATRFPDVRTKPLNVCDLSVYRQFDIKEQMKLQVRVDAHNVGNFPWFGVLDAAGASVASPLFGHLRADIGNETRVVVGVLKLVF